MEDTKQDFQPVPSAMGAALPPATSPGELRAFRLAMGWRLQDLAPLLGVTWNTLSRWERGQMAIQHPRMLAMALGFIQRKHQELTAPPVRRRGTFRHRG